MKSIQEKENTKLMKNSDEVKEKIILELSSFMKRTLANEPVLCDNVKSISPDELIEIRATKLRKIKNNTNYRVLYVKTRKEMALIIPPKLSIEVARESLHELKRLSNDLQLGEPPQLTPGAEIYLEYKRLFDSFGWHEKDIAQQISYDFLVALLMQKNKQEDSIVKEFADYYIHAIIGYLRMRKTDIEEYLEGVNKELDEEYLPFNPESGLIETYTLEHVRDANRAWRKDFGVFDSSMISANILVDFWMVGYLRGYWAILDSHQDLGKYNKVRRNRLIINLISNITTNFSELANPKFYAPESLRKFTEGLFPK